MDTPFDARLIPEPEPEGPETVSRVVRRLKDVLEVEFDRVWVVGEVSNFKRHGSGHLFFTLKDAGASLRCVMWRSTAERLHEAVEDGMEVEVKGHLSVFPRAGNVQLYVSSLKPRGVGPLEVAFRKLKEKLAAEGLFGPERKRPLPAFPRCVGVVTSPTGAAVRDIVHVLARRWPAVRVVLAPTRVQGDGAVDEIVAALGRLERRGGVDVVIVGRGGGSLEDLWPFNEERVARALFEYPVPVISAVGHETDVSISDFVADVRAPTPSAAAEMAVPDARDVGAALARRLRYLARHVAHRLERMRDRLALAARSRALARPEEWVLARVERVEDLAGRLARAARGTPATRRLRLAQLAGALAEHTPRLKWQQGRDALEMAAWRLRAAGRDRLEHRWRGGLERIEGRLRDLAPDRVLARGYSRTELVRTGRTLTRAADADIGDRLRTHLAEGTLESEVTEGGDPPRNRSRTKMKRRRRPRDPGAEGPRLFE